MEQAQADTIILETISQHFPELVGTFIKIYHVKKKDYYLAVGFHLFGYRLFIDKAALSLSDKAFKGIAAHELAHIVQFKEAGFLGRMKMMFFSKNEEETITERGADYQVISKGLGSELLQFHNEHNKNYKSYKSSEGLTKREIKQIIKKGKSSQRTFNDKQASDRNNKKTRGNYY